MEEALALKEKLESLLQNELDPYFLSIDEIHDSCGYKYHIVIVSSKFENLPTLAQHRMVYKVIENDRSEIHAITLKTWTIEKYQNSLAESNNNLTSVTATT